MEPDRLNHPGIARAESDRLKPPGIARAESDRLKPPGIARAEFGTYTLVDDMYNIIKELLIKYSQKCLRKVKIYVSRIPSSHTFMKYTTRLDNYYHLFNKDLRKMLKSKFRDDGIKMKIKSAIDFYDYDWCVPNKKDKFKYGGKMITCTWMRKH